MSLCSRRRTSQAPPLATQPAVAWAAAGAQPASYSTQLPAAPAAAGAQLPVAQPEVAWVVVAYPAVVEWVVAEQVVEQALEPGAVERRCSQDSSR